MKKFVVIYRVPVETMQKWRAETSPEEMQKQGKELGEKMNAWFAKHKNSIVDMGNPLGKNTRMTSSGAKQETNDLNFYQVVEADDVESVVAMMKDNPHMEIPESYLDIMEVPQIQM